MQNYLTRLLQNMAVVFDVASVEAMAGRLLIAAMVLIGAWYVSRTGQRWIIRHLQGRDSSEDETIRVYRLVIKVSVWGLAASIAIHTIGLNLTHLFTAGGLFAVGLAFAMKNLLENLVSGMILRLEGSIKAGDVLFISNGEMVKVQKIGIRTTIVRSKDESDRIIPNSDLVQKEITNNTFRDQLHRIGATVGVSYDCNANKIIAILQAACDCLDWKSEKRAPVVRLHHFGDSALVFQILVWVEDPWAAGRSQCDLNEAIWRALKEAEVNIAYPQLDVHIAPTLLK
jgi:potassium efflux system protein